MPATAEWLDKTERLVTESRLLGQAPALRAALLEVFAEVRRLKAQLAKEKELADRYRDLCR